MFKQLVLTQVRSLTILGLVIVLAPGAQAADGLKIAKLEPTVLFAKAKAGEPLQQVVRLAVENGGVATQARVKVAMAGMPSQEEALGQVGPGATSKEIHVPDVDRPTELTVELYGPGNTEPVDVKKVVWQAQKKWKVYCVSYSHHDLGFGNYPHRLRTEIRHANIERPLKFCAETDTWDEDSKFRFVIETSEPITSFLGSHGEADAEELARRIRDGRIQIGAVHNTANTEQLSQELMARLFYLAGRHTRDLLDVPPSKTAQIDDVIGLTWPFATFCKEAGVPYLFHGYNPCGSCLQPANAEPVFFWQGPGGERSPKLLVRSFPYAISLDSIHDGSEAAIEKMIGGFVAKGWPYDALLSQDGTDFTLVSLGNANKIRACNAKWAYPRLICATMDMFFDAIAAQADPAKIQTFAKDGNNQWADQDATDAALLGLARRQGEATATAEKFATIATVLAGGGYPWTDLYQAYHRLLAYHEHTDAIDTIGPARERMQQYETELEENREMVREAKEFGDRARDGALVKLAGLIATEADRNVLVFNPLARVRTDVVHIAAADLGQGVRLVDSTTKQEVAHQELADGNVVFVAADVPSLGYKAFSVLPASATAAPEGESSDHALENRFYRIEFDPVTGAIVSLRDKQLGRELVDQAAPYKFNEYLYERFEKSSLQDAAKWHRVQSAQLSRASGPVAQVMTIQAAAVGADRLRQTVILYRDLQRIDFVLDMVKSPSGRTCYLPNASMLNKESAYVSLPLSVPDFRFHHELPGGVAEPIRDQFEGSCTAYYAMRHFADVANDRFGVTVSSPDIALVEYGRPRSCPIPGGREGDFEKTMLYPTNSRMYLYLLNNMFDVNIRWDQRGPMRFAWSLRSHEGNWQQGRADQFGWDILNPLVPKLALGRKKGVLPCASSFLSVDAPNVVCTTMKPAEHNGAGLILRFHETQGKGTTTAVSLPLVQTIARAVETDLVENDRPVPLSVVRGNQVCFAIEPFGVKTIRIVPATKAPPEQVAGLRAEPVSDMQVELSWQVAAQEGTRLSHFNVYRGSKSDFRPSLRNLVARPSGPAYLDQPQLNYGGWINHRLEPETTYYYRVSAVDCTNHEGPLSPAVKATTHKASEKNMVPLRVEGVRAILVSPLAHLNYVNLMFRTNCESDLRGYEIHRSSQSGFTPNDSTRIGVAEASTLVKGSTAYGHVPVDYRVDQYDHMMFQDDAVQAATTYYYRVRAIDTAGQKGDFSQEVAVSTKSPSNPGAKVSASSVFAPEYGPECAIDGSPDPYAAWISKPYGGGTAEKPVDAWWTVEFPRPMKLQGVTMLGDDRSVIPVQNAFRIEYRESGTWKTAAEVRDATTKNVTVKWPAPLEIASLRVYVPAKDLPKSSQPDIPDGVVRVCELMLILPDGQEVAVPDVFRP